jgi:hypothetical protein
MLMLLIYLILPLTQLSFFPEEVEVFSSNEVTRRCSKCEIEKSLLSFNNKSHLCHSCSTEYHRTIRQIRKENSVPELHCCDICGRDEGDLRNDTMNPRGSGKIIKKSPWRIDHCHKTDTFRSYLCHKCNLGIGFLEDDTDRLRKAIEYLDKHNGYTD